MTKKDDDNVSREAIFSAIVAEAGGFYKIITTIGGGFLGGSLVFMEKIAPHPAKWTLWHFLLPAWILILASGAIVVFVRRKNLESGRLALEGKFDDAIKIDRQTSRLSTIVTFVLIIGVLLLMLFGFANLVIA
ncbi:MAG: hypothetical protein ACYS8W_14285 [Planctomycetota bacterium]|jgi:hypothetical protein